MKVATIVLCTVTVLAVSAGFPSSSLGYDPFRRPVVHEKKKVEKPPRPYAGPRIAPGGARPAPKKRKKKVIWQLPENFGKGFLVIGKYKSFYIVKDRNSGNTFLWKRGTVINHCKIMHGEVVCYEKKVEYE